jgi:hypothetical protein
MRAVLIRITRIYFGIGTVFGGLLAISYLWGTLTGASCFPGTGLSGFISYFVFFLSAIGYALFGFVVRTILWLPSLVHWYIYGPEPSFLFWLMPGLYIRCGPN